MILHSIVIDNIRGIEHLELTDIPESGVIVIAGDNEAGKSTILDALHTVLHIRHSSKSHGIRSMQPVGKDVGPRIQVNATIGPYTFTIDKTYLRKKSAHLSITSPRAEQYTGTEADQKLEGIISEHLDNDLFEALLMRQGKLDAGIRAVGIPSLVAALEENQAPDTTDDSALMKRIDAEYSRYFTLKTGAPTGELKVAHTRCAKAEATMLEAQKELQALEQYVERHEAAKLQLAEVRERRPAAEEELERAESQYAEAKTIEEHINNAQASVTTAQAELRLAESEVDARKRHMDGVEQARARLVELHNNTEELRVAHEQATAEKTRVYERFLQAQETARETAAALQQAQDDVEACRDAAALQQAKELAEKLARAEQEVVRLRAAQPKRIITQADVARVEQAQFALRSAEIQQAALAAKVSLRATDPTEVFIDGTAVEIAETHHEIEVIGETTLVIGGVTVTMSAGAHGDTAQLEVAEARRRLDQVLQRLGCANLEAVHKAKQKCENLQRELRDSEHRLEVLHPSGESLHQLYARIELLSEKDFSDLPDAHTAEAAVPVARRRYEEAESALTVVRAELDGLDVSATQSSLKVHVARVSDAEEHLERLQEEYAQLEAAVPVAVLEARVDEATRRRIEAVQKLQEIQVADLDIDVAQRILAGAKAQIKHLNEHELMAEKTLAELHGRIVQATGAAERYERAVAAWKSAQSQKDSVQRRADAVNMLRSALLRHRDIAREKYAQPFMDALTNLAKPVFGNDVGFTLTQELQIDQRESKNIPLNIDALSAGAQEQLAILTRLAIAKLVSNDAVPIIIDDALGSSDSARIGLMSTLFSKLGQRHQVLILTCDQNRYLRVVGAKILRIEQLKN